MGVAPKYSGDTNPPLVEYFDPDEFMIVALRRAVVNKQDIRINVEGQGHLFLLGSRSEYFVETLDEARFFSAPLSQVKITLLEGDDALTSSEDPPIPGEEVIGRGIDELMWQAVYHASAGRLMKGCFRDDVVKLEFWPNLTRLPHGPNSMRIAALLCCYPTSIMLAARLLKVDLGEVSQFYSAARAAGLARAVNRSNLHPKLEPYRNQSRFSALFKKVVRL